MEYYPKKEGMEGGSIESQGRGWVQADLQDKYRGLRGQYVQMSTYGLRVLAGRRGALLIHLGSDSVNPNAFGDDGSGQGRIAAPL